MAKEKAVIIDNEPSTRALIRNMINDRYEVEAISDATDILDQLTKNEAPNLIIADISLPGMDGFTFIEKLRKQEGFQELPLIILSGKEHNDDRIRALRLGADDYVVKPFNPDELMSRIRKVT